MMDDQMVEAMATENKPKFSVVLKKLANYSRKYWGAVSFVIIGSIASVIISLVAPDFMGNIVDIIIAGPMTGFMDFDELWRIATILLVLYGGNFLIGTTSMQLMANTIAQLTKKMRKDLSAKIDRVPLAYFDKNQTGDTLSRVTNDVDTLGNTLNQSFVGIITSIVMFVGSLIMMFRANWIMALSGIGATLIGFILMSVLGATAQKSFIAQREELGELTSQVEETFTGHAVITNHNAENHVSEKFDDINEKLEKSSFKAQFISGVMMPLMMFIGNLSFVVVTVVGAVLVINGDITFGVIAQFMMYIRLFTQPLGEIASGMMMLQGAAASSNRIFEFLEEEEMEDESHKTADIEKVEGNVVFEQLKFEYVEGQPVINNFSAFVRAGQKVAIVGPTGAGKTTTVNLLMRFYETTGGYISVDGVKLSDMPREKVYDLFCMVLQDTWLFEASVRENLVYNQEGISQEDIERVCKAVGIHHYFKSLPQGYDTILTDKVSLSVGQKQLLTIARAMLSDAPLLILDEATSSVDTRTEILIQEAMDKLMKGRTSFVIAHRLSTIKNADLILVMDKGDIVESGSHEELLEKEGFYAKLYNSQFEVVDESA